MLSTLPGWRDWLFSARSFAAAMLALYLALWFDLPRPYWAVGTVYIVIQPLSGALRAKALARFLGTLAGGAFAVAAVPMLVDAPPLLVLVLALWVAGCTMGSLYDPTPRSYAFRLAGFTAALIAFPSVDAPGTIFDTALARIEEIGLGILCVTLVDQVFPRPATPVLLARLEAWIGGMARFGADALSGRMEEGRFLAERRRVARDGAALDALFEETRYEAGGHRTGLAWVRALRARARTVPAMISAVADRAHALRRDDPAAASCSSGASARPAAAGGRRLAGRNRRPGAARCRPRGGACPARPAAGRRACRRRGRRLVLPAAGGAARPAGRAGRDLVPRPGAGAARRRASPPRRGRPRRRSPASMSIRCWSASPGFRWWSRCWPATWPGWRPAGRRAARRR